MRNSGGRTPACGNRTSSSSREILLLISVSEGPFAPEDRVEPGKGKMKRDQHCPVGLLMWSISFRFTSRLAGGQKAVCQQCCQQGSMGSNLALLMLHMQQPGHRPGAAVTEASTIAVRAAEHGDAPFGPHLQILVTGIGND